MYIHVSTLLVQQNRVHLAYHFHFLILQQYDQNRMLPSCSTWPYNATSVNHYEDHVIHLTVINLRTYPKYAYDEDEQIPRSPLT